MQKKRACRKQVFFIFANNSRSRQNKENTEHPFVDIGKYEKCAKFSKNIELYGSWSSSKFSIFEIEKLVSRKQ